MAATARQSRTRPPACTCAEHRADGAPTTIGAHGYRLHMNQLADYAWEYHATCDCGPRYRSQRQCQSDAVAYHAWRRHVARAGS